VQSEEKSLLSGNSWYVYIVRCADSSYYTGVTVSLDRRLRQHNGELAGGARYTRPRRPVRLVWSQKATSRSMAQRLEAALRRLPTVQKDRLVRANQQLIAFEGGWRVGER